MPTQSTKAILKGSGTDRDPYWVQGFRKKESRSLNTILSLCEKKGIAHLSVAYSGLYYEYRADGWYLTSDSEQCDKTHGLPSEGRKV